MAVLGNLELVVWFPATPLHGFNNNMSAKILQPSDNIFQD